MPRCVCCSRRTDAYYCDSCAWATDYVAARQQDDYRAVTATSVSRSYQRRLERAVAHEQLVQLQTIAEHTCASDGESARSLWLRSARAALHPSLTHAERQRLAEKMPSRVGPFREYASKRLRDAEKLAKGAA